MDTHPDTDNRFEHDDARAPKDISSPKSDEREEQVDDDFGFKSLFEYPPTSEQGYAHTRRGGSGRSRIQRDVTAADEPVRGAHAIRHQKPMWPVFQKPSEGTADSDASDETDKAPSRTTKRRIPLPAFVSSSKHTHTAGASDDQTPASTQKSAAPADGKHTPGAHKQGDQAHVSSASSSAPSSAKADGAHVPEATQTNNETPAEKKRRWAKEEIRLFVVRLSALLLSIFIIFGFIFGIYPVSTEEMKPRISAGDLVLYYRLSGDPQINEVVVYTYNGELHIGRVAGRPGDTIDISDENQLLVNDHMAIENNIYYPTTKFEGGIEMPLTVPENSYFVLGDYREGAKDSRMYGPISKDTIRGSVVTVVRRTEI